MPSTVALGGLELFAGAGGMASGLAQASIKTLFMNDSWGSASQTFRSNLAVDAHSEADARDLRAEDIYAAVPAARTTPLVVAGGPPCQGFSSAGSRSATDARNSLVGVFVRLAVELNARWIVFENVEGFLTLERGRFVVDLLGPLIMSGYQVRLRKVDMAYYGVPQHRKRVVVMARLGSDPGFPSPMTRALVTVEDAFMGLGQPDTPRAPTGHDAPVLSELARRRIKSLAPGQTSKDLPEDLRPASYQRRARRRVLDGTLSERRGGPPTGMRRLRGDKPSPTITGGAPLELVHPAEDRLLTVRECARLQGFSDDFQFCGSRSDQSLLIGNAVPPPFAKIIGNWIVAREHEASDCGGGALLEFMVGPEPPVGSALWRTQRDMVGRFQEQRLPF